MFNVRVETPSTLKNLSLVRYLHKPLPSPPHWNCYKILYQSYIEALFSEHNLVVILTNVLILSYFSMKVSEYHAHSATNPTPAQHHSSDTSRFTTLDITNISVTSAGRVSLINIIMKITRWWFMKDADFIVICVDEVLLGEDILQRTRERIMAMNSRQLDELIIHDCPDT